MAFKELNNVLCINDSDITLFILKRTLNKSNFADKITEKKDGREALSYCQQLIDNGEYREGNYPKVIFLDLHMPVMDGWEFMEKFLSQIWPYFKETKIIITSQSIYNGDFVRAKQYPFVMDFLKHAISVEYLVRIRESLLAHSLHG